MQNGVEHHGQEPATPGRSWVKSALDAVLFAETLIAGRVLVGGFSEELSARAASKNGSRNAFGEVVTVAQAKSAGELATTFADLAAQGERVSLIAPAHALLTARETLQDVARRRLGTVVHLIADRSLADALAFADLGWGLLFAANAEDSFDLALVARRAAEDSGTPFFVVHESHASIRHVEWIGVGSSELVSVFVGPASARLHKEDNAAHPKHAVVDERAFLERVPFALGSAMRELESLTGRRHDVIERVPSSDAQLVLLGLGEIGESLLAQVERLRDAGHDVGAVKLTALRPFPGVRLVKTLGRALAVTVIEAVDEPLAQSNPLTRELKAAFADAITWAPGYPGVGRVPRVVSGYVGRGRRELDGVDLEAIVANMAQGEREIRSFVLGAPHAAGEGGQGGSRDEANDRLAKVAPTAGVPGPSFSMRARVPTAAIGEATAELCAQVVMNALGLRTRATVRPAPLADGGDALVDLFAARERPRGVHPPHAVKIVLLDTLTSLLQGHPLARLATRGTLVLPTAQATGEAVWSELPAYAKALVFDRHARVIGFEKPDLGADDLPWAHAAIIAGVSIGAAGAPARPVIDGSRLAREVEAALTVVLGPGHAEAAKRCGEMARAAMESVVEVPRAVIERDEEAIRLGRRDARASEAPR